MRKWSIHQEDIGLDNSLSFSIRCYRKHKQTFWQAQYNNLNIYLPDMRSPKYVKQNNIGKMINI